MLTQVSGEQRKHDAGVEPLLTLEDAASVLGLTHWTIRNYIKAGRIRYVIVGRRYMVEPDEVRGFIRRCVASA